MTSPDLDRLQQAQIAVAAAIAAGRNYIGDVGYVIGDLAGYRAADLYPVVSEAFADYVIRRGADAASLDALLTRRGWEPAWSFGLFRRERLAGFWLTGRDEGHTEAYCIMTGILPEARGSGGADA